MIASVSARRQHAAVPRARVIGMAVRDQRPRHRARRVDVEVRLGAIEPFGAGM